MIRKERPNCTCNSWEWARLRKTKGSQIALLVSYRVSNIWIALSSSLGNVIYVPKYCDWQTKNEKLEDTGVVPLVLKNSAQWGYDINKVPRQAVLKENSWYYSILITW